jgi:hypothetical protein
MSVLDNILAYVSLTNTKLEYVKTTSTDYIFDLIGYSLPKPIIDKNSGKILKNRTSIILLDINQQNIGMYDYSVANFGGNVRFTLPKANFEYTITSDDILQITGTFTK